ncbi:hypothetical protein BDV96DRAFT_595913 [Lophiotrema nucula]|uniref:Uncharacterized protein n=1 Tax=Lophiotrema nucula TaxID=690887 RepID=A0A6A5ZL94_9PLEO|nr:hypothetical protein BDV96DRAFT_595913 [Lophiotrema nucula]
MPIAPAMRPGSPAETDHRTVKRHAYSLVDEEPQSPKRYFVEFIDQEDLSYRPIDKAARIIYVGAHVSNIKFLLRRSDSGTVVHHFPTNRIDRRFTAREPNCLPIEALQLPERLLVDELLQAYSDRVNPGFPVVD